MNTLALFAAYALGEGLLGGLLSILVAALVLLVIFWIAKKFFPPEFITIVGAILGIVFLIVSLKVFNVF